MKKLFLRLSPKGKTLLAAACRRDQWVNKAENNPLAVFMCPHVQHDFFRPSTDHIIDFSKVRAARAAQLFFLRQPIMLLICNVVGHVIISQTLNFIFIFMTHDDTELKRVKRD